MSDMPKRKAAFWKSDTNKAVNCLLCPQACKIEENAVGFCGIRQNIGGELYGIGYGLVSALALDPIEKKPLAMFRPGKNILSIGGFGCNLRCPFCQNSRISMEYSDRWHDAQYFLPEQIVEAAKKTEASGNIGVAYTYNEPLINYEFIYDCAKLIHKTGMSNVIVSNGFINTEPLEQLLPFIDAMNIDLKGFFDELYKKLGSKQAGGADEVKQTIAMAHKHCHVEITTLVIPEENEDEIEPLCEWIASIDDKIPLHLNRFFPRFKYSDKTPTSLQTLQKFNDIAKKYLKNVIVGNVR